VRLDISACRTRSVKHPLFLKYKDIINFGFSCAAFLIACASFIHTIRRSAQDRKFRAVSEISSLQDLFNDPKFHNLFSIVRKYNMGKPKWDTIITKYIDARGRTKERRSGSIYILGASIIHGAYFEHGKNQEEVAIIKASVQHAIDTLFRMQLYIDEHIIKKHQAGYIVSDVALHVFKMIFECVRQLETENETSRFPMSSRQARQVASFIKSATGVDMRIKEKRKVIRVDDIAAV
jgi:hypothetical protein